jgi:hypothetical protein
MPIDHLVYAVPDLDAAIDRLEALLGVRATPGGQHPGAGTRNALIGLGGEAYLEVIGPDPDQPAPGDGPRRFGIDELVGPRLVTWAIKAPGIEERVEQARRAGWDPGAPQAMSRRRPDGVELHWKLTRAPDGVGDGLVPFLIDWGKTEHPASNLPGGCELVRIRGEHPEAGKVRDALLAMGEDLSLIPGPEPVLAAIIRTASGEEVELR